MLRSMFMIFQSSPRQLARQQLFQAQRELVSHAGLAEYHSAMASMYRERAARLAAIVDEPAIDSRITEAQRAGATS